MIRYFARINDKNIVIDVRVTTPEFMAENPDRYPGVWIETFFDSVDKIYAGIGFIWNPQTKNFEYPPMPDIENRAPYE